MWYKMPFLNGFFFRTFPHLFLKFAYNKFYKNNLHKILKIHNWEMDVKQPRLPVGCKGNLIHYNNLNSTLPKIEYFVKFFQLNTLDEIANLELKNHLDEISFDNQLKGA